jgi:hypothetical protein
MWLSPRLQHMVTTEGHSRSGRAQWFRLAGVQGHDIGCLNVYAPNETTARNELWRELFLALPKDCRWVLIGDWNFVERDKDRSLPRRHALNLDEAYAFH